MQSDRRLTLIDLYPGNSLKQKLSALYRDIKRIYPSLPTDIINILNEYLIPALSQEEERDQLMKLTTQADLQHTLHYAVLSKNRLINSLPFIRRLIALGAQLSNEHHSLNTMWFCSYFNHYPATVEARRIHFLNIESADFFPIATYTYCDEETLNYFFSVNMPLLAPHEIHKPDFYSLQIPQKTVLFLMKKGKELGDTSCSAALDLLNGIIPADIDSYPDLYPEHYAAMNGDSNLVLMILNHGRNIYIALFAAIQYGQMELVYMLIDMLIAKNASLNLPPEEQYPIPDARTYFSTMCIAAMSGNTDCIRLLHSYGVSVSSKQAIFRGRKPEYTPLMLAVLTGQANSVATLLELGADLTIEGKCKYGRYYFNALTLATLLGDIKIMQLLLVKKRQCVSTAFEFSSKQRRSIVTTRENDTREDERRYMPWENDYWSPLMYAVHDGNLAAIQVLFDAGEDPYAGARESFAWFVNTSVYDQQGITNKYVFFSKRGVRYENAFSAAQSPEVFDFLFFLVRSAYVRHLPSQVYSAPDTRYASNEDLYEYYRFIALARKSQPDAITMIQAAAHSKNVLVNMSFIQHLVNIAHSATCSSSSSASIMSYDELLDWARQCIFHRHNQCLINKGIACWYTYANAPIESLSSLFTKVPYVAPHDLEPSEFHLYQISSERMAFILQEGINQDNEECRFALDALNGTLYIPSQPVCSLLYLVRYAAMNNQIYTVMQLISLADNSIHIAILTAAQYGHVDLLTELLAIQDSYRVSTIDCYGENNTNYYATAMCLTAMHGHAACIRILASHGASVNGMQYRVMFNYNGSSRHFFNNYLSSTLTPLMCATANKKMESVVALIDLMEKDFSWRNLPSFLFECAERETDLTALSIAISNYDLDIALLLLKKGDEPSKIHANYLLCLLHHAVDSNNTLLTHFLIKIGVSPYERSTNYPAMNAFERVESQEMFNLLYEMVREREYSSELPIVSHLTSASGPGFFASAATSRTAKNTDATASDSSSALIVSALESNTLQIKHYKRYHKDAAFRNQRLLCHQRYRAPIVTIEDIISEDNIEYLLDAVETWGGTNPRILMPNDPDDRRVLRVLVANKGNHYLCTGTIAVDLEGRFHCSVFVDNEEYYTVEDEKVYHYPYDKEALRRDFAGIVFKPPRVPKDHPESTHWVIVDFKPSVKEQQRKRAQDNALVESKDVKSEFASAAAPAQRERNDTKSDVNDSESAAYSPRPGSRNPDA